MGMTQVIKSNNGHFRIGAISVKSYAREFTGSIALASLVLASVPLQAESTNLPDKNGDTAIAQSRGKYEVKANLSNFVAMRDGVKLSTDLYFPQGAKGPLPIVLVRTPYGKADNDEFTQYFASHGFVVAIQDLRGVRESEGEFFANSAGEAEDGYDTVDWLSKQPWSNGKIGTIGCSYLGEVQHALATTRHPAHRAAIIGGDSAYKDGQIYAQGFRFNGALELSSALGWNLGLPKYSYGPPPNVDRQTWFKSGHSKNYQTTGELKEYSASKALMQLPVIDIADSLGAAPSHYREWVGEKPNSPYWKRLLGFTKESKFSVPALHVSSWYDFNHSPRAAFNFYKKNGIDLKTKTNQHLILGPGTHCEIEDGTAQTQIGERQFGDTRLDFWRLYLDWFNHWLNDSPTPPKIPPVLVYVMGANQWRSETDWPLERQSVTKFFLHSEGQANGRFGDGELQQTPSDKQHSVDKFSYDPGSPTPTRGGSICCTGDLNLPEGPVDVADIEMRQDVLVYTTPVLKTPIEITGEVGVDIYLSSDAPDTDLVARLTEVDAAGRSWVLLDGIMRMRHAEGLDREIRLQPGVPQRARINLGAISIAIPAGHRIRLDLASAGFPRWDRNLNTGGDNARETVWRIAQNSIHHDSRYPSSLILPIVKSSPASAWWRPWGTGRRPY
jgi:uncharacterized protein